MASAPVMVVKLRSFSVGRQRGELARLRVVKGADRGVGFVLVNTRASIGRGEENDITIGDLKASRLHAEVSAGPTGWVVRDLGSANGVLVNGRQSREAMLKTTDLLTVGETVLEFLGGDAPEQLLLAGPRDELEADRMLQARLQSRERARTLRDPFGLNAEASAAPAAPAAGPKKFIRLALVGVLALAAVLGGDLLTGKPEPSAKKTRKVAGVESGPVDLASLMPKLEKPVTSRNAEIFFKQGFREYRARNYIRALNQFELVLQMDPDHEMARRYRDNARLAIEDEVKTHLERGKKDFAAGKLRDARGHYEAILRLLFSDQSNPAYAEAKGQLEKVRSEMGDE